MLGALVAKAVENTIKPNKPNQKALEGVLKRNISLLTTYHPWSEQSRKQQSSEQMGPTFSKVLPGAAGHYGGK